MPTYDLLIIVPLEEEFQVFREYFKPENSISALPPFYYPVSFTGLHRKSCVGVIGKMGTAPAAAMAAQAISDLNPKIVILVGIAGTLDDDLHLGEIAVASQIFEYEALGKAKAAGTGYIYQRSSYTFRTDPKLRDLADHFRNSDQIYADWQEAVRCQAAREGIPFQGFLTRSSWPGLQVGFIASGNTVSASGVYKGELKERDRKLVALEMEAAGVAHAVENSPNQPRLFVVRGISDWSDERKADLEQGGAWRRLAMFSVCAFLERFFNSPGLTLLFAEAWKSRQENGREEDLPARSIAPVTHRSFEYALALSLEDRNAIGDMIAESQTVDDQQLRQAFCRDLGMNTRSLRITELPPEQFGRALVDLIIDTERISAWERLGVKLRKILEGRQLELLNQILERARQNN